MIEYPSDKQKDLAIRLGIVVSSQTKRVLSAQIEDAYEQKAFDYIERFNLRKGDQVIYKGRRADMPKELLISTVGKNGFLYFKGTHKYCRPWDIKKV